MKGKKKNKRKVGKIILLGMSFLLTIILTFSFTMAWFYDADWSSNFVHMAGSVGIEIRKQQKYDGEGNPIYPTLTTSGAGNLHFTITTDKAYPGQAIDVSAINKDSLIVVDVAGSASTQSTAYGGTIGAYVAINDVNSYTER